MRTIYFLLVFGTALHAAVSDEIVKDWIVQDEQFRKANNTAAAFSPEHTKQVVASALALAERVRRIPGADATKINSVTESLRSLNIGTEPNESLVSSMYKHD